MSGPRVSDGGGGRRSLMHIRPNAGERTHGHRGAGASMHAKITRQWYLFTENCCHGNRALKHYSVLAAIMCTNSKYLKVFRGRAAPRAAVRGWSSLYPVNGEIVGLLFETPSHRGAGYHFKRNYEEQSGNNW